MANKEHVEKAAGQIAKAIEQFVQTTVNRSQLGDDIHLGNLERRYVFKTDKPLSTGLPPISIDKNHYWIFRRSSSDTPLSARVKNLPSGEEAPREGSISEVFVLEMLKLGHNNTYKVDVVFTADKLRGNEYSPIEGLGKRGLIELPRKTYCPEISHENALRIHKLSSTFSFADAIAMSEYTPQMLDEQKSVVMRQGGTKTVVVPMGPNGIMAKFLLAAQNKQTVVTLSEIRPSIKKMAEKVRTVEFDGEIMLDVGTEKWFRVCRKMLAEGNENYKKSIVDLTKFSFRFVPVCSQKSYDATNIKTHPAIACLPPAKAAKALESSANVVSVAVWMNFLPRDDRFHQMMKAQAKPKILEEEDISSTEAVNQF